MFMRKDATLVQALYSRSHKDHISNIYMKNLMSYKSQLMMIYLV